MTEASNAADLVGQLIDGRYRINRELAKGGMAVVYEATHEKIGRTVAIKVLHRELAGDAEVVGRFLNEARAVGTFGHANIVASTDFGELPGHVPYLVLEYLDGHTLAREVEASGPLATERVMWIALQIASAVDAAHARNIVHRDLTSSNIFMVKGHPSADHVKVLDFGISKFLIGGAGGPKTKRGFSMGTPEFMAPEQISDPDAVDSRVDVYALGVIIYQMLAGRLPFTGVPLQSLLAQIIVEHAPPIDRLDVPQELLAIIEHAMAKTPDERFPSMRAMGYALEGAWANAFADRTWEGLEIPSFSAGAISISRGAASTTGWNSGVSIGRQRSGQVPFNTPGPITAPPIVTAAVTLQPPVTLPPAAPASGKSRVLLASAVVVALAAAAGFGVRSFRQQSAPVVKVAQPIEPPAPPLPAFVHVEAKSPTPSARVTLRGRTHLLPFSADVARGSEPEIVELTAPGREGRRYWITLDKGISLSAALGEGKNVSEASEEETVIALGGMPVDGEKPSEAEGPAEPPKPEAKASEAQRRRAIRRRLDGPRSRAGGSLPVRASAGDELRGAGGTPANLVPMVALSEPATPRAAPAIEPAVPAASAPATEVKAAPPKPAEAVPRAPSAAPAGAAPGMDPAKTQAAVKSHLGEIQRCYERGKMDDADLKGRITVRIAVSVTGAVSSAAVDTSTLQSPPVEACIISAVQRWKLPAPVGGTAVISYPFNLR